MIYIFIVTSLVFGLCMYAYYRKYEKIKKNLSYLKGKIHEVNESEGYQTVKVVTGDREVREILNEINKLLEIKHSRDVQYRGLETSMKQMVSNISHDLKTPLTVILGYVETELLNQDMDQSTRNNLEIVNKKSEELLQLINQFFSLSKLDSGDFNIDLQRIELVEFVKTVIASMYKVIQQAKVQVDLNLPEEKIFLRTNEEMLRRMVNNIISNALKYGAEGGYLGIKVYKEDGICNIEIIDKGKGIPKEYQKRVFDRLFTLEDSRNKRYQGSGLGLSIAKKIAENLGGDIQLESTPHKRTVFRISIRG